MLPGFGKWLSIAKKPRMRSSGNWKLHIMLGFAQEKQGIMLQSVGGQRCRYL